MAVLGLCGVVVSFDFDFVWWWGSSRVRVWPQQMGRSFRCGVVPEAVLPEAAIERVVLLLHGIKALAIARQKLQESLRRHVRFAAGSSKSNTQHVQKTQTTHRRR